MAIETIKIDHVQITVQAAVEAACKHFYGVTLGLSEIPKPDNLKKRGGAWYRLGEIEMHLSVEESASGNRSSRRHLCFVVRNLAEAERNLQQAGVEIIADKQPVPEWRRFYVRDPGGNRIEIAERVSDAGQDSP